MCLRIPSDYPDFGSQSCLCHSATLERGLGGINIKNNEGKIHKPLAGQINVIRKNHRIEKMITIIILIGRVCTLFSLFICQTTSKGYFSIYFDNKHTQSIVIEAAYFNINLSTTLTGMLIIFIRETMSLPLILELILI